MLSPLLNQELPGGVHWSSSNELSNKEPSEVSDDTIQTEAHQITEEESKLVSNSQTIDEEDKN